MQKDKQFSVFNSGSQSFALKGLYFPADCVPRCRRCKAWAFQGSVGLYGRATPAWQALSAIPEQEGHGGCTWEVEVRFRDATGD